MALRTETDALLRTAMEVLDDPGRPEAQKVALVRSQLAVVLARRKARRIERAMEGTVREWIETIGTEPQ